MIGSFMRKHGHKGVALVVWLGIIIGYWWMAHRYTLTPVEVIRLLSDLLTTFPYGPFVYVGLYLLRPLLLFPSIVLSIAAGYLYGPVWGMVLATLGANGSASVDYLVGRFFGEGILDAAPMESLLQRYTERLRANSFEAVLIMRLMFLPFDSVSLLVGFLRLSWQPYALATLVGGVPGALAFILFGASLEGDLLVERPEIQPWTLALAGLMFIVSIGLSRYVRRREESMV